MNRREVIGFAVAACVACCIGPILGVLGAIAALGLASTIVIGTTGLLVAVAAVAAFIVVRRRSCASATVANTVPIEVSRRTP